jgi:hypothetical protein
MQHGGTQSPLANWQGTCVIDGEAEPARWRECRVIGISPDGMGLTLRHEEPADLVERTVQVQFPGSNGSLQVSLEGTVRSAKAVGAGVIRVGLEFRGLTRSERALATVLEVLIQTYEPVEPDLTRDTPSQSISPPRWTTERVAPRLEVLQGA